MDAEDPNEIVNLRNKISGVAMEVSRARANEILAHPIFGPVNEIVRTAKPEVLAHPKEDAPAIEVKDEVKA